MAAASCVVMSPGSLVLPTKDVLHGSTDEAGVPGWGVGARHHQADGLDPVPPVGLLHTVAATAAPHAHVD